ncbi:MAG: hypothetical protein ACWGNK_04125 [Desulfobacterales bacterium]
MKSTVFKICNQFHGLIASRSPRRRLRADSRAGLKLGTHSFKLNLSCLINTAAFSFDNAVFVQTKYDIANLLFVESGFFFDIRQTGPLFESLNYLKYLVDGCRTAAAFDFFAPLVPDGCLAAAFGGVARRFQQFFDLIQLVHQFVDVFFGWNIVGMHKKFHHCIETNVLALVSHVSSPSGFKNKSLKINEN